MGAPDQSRAEIHAAIALAWAKVRADLPRTEFSDVEKMLYREGFIAGALWANEKAQRIARDTLGSAA